MARTTRRHRPLRRRGLFRPWLEQLESRRLLANVLLDDETFKTVEFTIENGVYEVTVTEDDGVTGVYVDNFNGVANYTGRLVYSSPVKALGRLDAAGVGSGTDNFHDTAQDFDSYSFVFDGRGTLTEENGEFRLFRGTQSFSYTSGDQPNPRNPFAGAGGTPFDGTVTGTIDTTTIPWQVTGAFSRFVGDVTFDGTVELGAAVFANPEPFDATIKSGVWRAEQREARFEFVSTGLVLPSPVEGREAPVADIRVFYATGPKRGDILDEANPIAGGAALPIYWNSANTQISLTDLPPVPPDARYLIVVADLDESIPQSREPDKANNLLAIPAAIIVDSVADTPDADTTDFRCADAAGHCTLRAAMQTADANPGHDTILFDLSGGEQMIHLEGPLDAITDPVTIDGTSQQGYAENADGYPIPAIHVSSQELEGSGFQVAASNTTIRGLNILSRVTIQAGAKNVTLEKNVIGTESSVHRTSGVLIDNASGNLVSRNIIAGHLDTEVTITGAGAFDNVVSFNRIGVTADGQDDVLQLRENYESKPVTDGNYGVLILEASGNQILENQISGAPTLDSQSSRWSAAAIRITGAGADGNLVRGNSLGFDAAGVMAFVTSVQNSPIHSMGFVRIEEGSGNRIVDNLMTGLVIQGNNAHANVVTGNRIGVNAKVTTVADLNGGVSVEADSNIIGGPDISDRNYLGHHQLRVVGNGNRLENNFQGVQVDGQTRIGGSHSNIGVVIDGDSNVLARNVIAFQHDTGILLHPSDGNQILENSIFGHEGVAIRMESGTRNSILGNTIFDNQGLAIDLGDDGVTPNDTDDHDNGANNKQNFPRFFNVSANEARGSINTRRGARTIRIEFFSDVHSDQQQHGQGRQFLGFLSRMTGVDGIAPFVFTFPEPLAENACVTATATDPDGNTSEFSRCVRVGTISPIQLPTAGGSLELEVGDTGGFDVGDTVVLNPGGSNEELAVIDGFGSLLLTRPLRFSHAAGEPVVVAGPDFDFDGVDNHLENAAPDQGDGNRDGILDAEQPHVASLMNRTESFITLVAPAGTFLANVKILEAPASAPTPAGIAFPDGLISFELGNARLGESIEVTIISHGTNHPLSYWNYGPTELHSDNQWYDFTLDGATGAKIVDDRILLHLMDGGLGDGDLVANGVIVGSGGPSPSFQVSASKLDTIIAGNQVDGRAGPGDAIRYTVVLTNSSRQDAHSVIFYDEVDPHTALIVGSVTTTQGTVMSGNGPGETLVRVDAGTILAESKVTISFDAMVIHRLPPGVNQVMNQGTVSGGNFAASLTDDPDTSARDDATATAIREVQRDFGDAPLASQSGFASDYPTQLPNGARHVPSALFLGASIDAETDGQPTASADGDGDDEDGVRVITPLVSTPASHTGSSFLIVVSAPGKLDAWIDFNRDGDWLDADERLFSTSFALVAGANLVSFRVPAGASAGDTHARFRLSSMGGLEPTGLADDGEVEDYRLTILDGRDGVEVALDLGVGDVEVVADASDVVVRLAGTELFRAPGGVLTSLSFLGTPGDDTVSLGSLASVIAVPLPLSYDGRSGVDTLRLIGSNQALELTDRTLNRLANLEVLDIVGNGPNQLTLDEQSILDALGATDTLFVQHDEDDLVKYSGLWNVLMPKFVDGQFVHVLRQGSAEVLVINTRPWQNPYNRFDANRDGSVAPLDVLVDINTLNEAGPRRLAPPRPGALPNFYYDSNGDDFVSPLDPLQRINALNNAFGTGEAERDSIPASNRFGFEPVLRFEPDLTGRDGGDRVRHTSLSLRSSECTRQQPRLGRSDPICEPHHFPRLFGPHLVPDRPPKKHQAPAVGEPPKSLVAESIDSVFAYWQT